MPRQLAGSEPSVNRAGPPFSGAIVEPGVAFVAADGGSSLDSRYFGPVSLDDLTPALPLWTSAQREIILAGGEKSRREYESKKEAEKVKLWVTSELQIAEERTVADAKKEYLMYRGAKKQNTPGSVEDTDDRLGTVEHHAAAGRRSLVTAHAMRGLHGTLAVDSGITSHAVAAALGHESFKTTAESYAQRDAVAGAQQKRVLGVLAGGKIAS